MTDRISELRRLLATTTENLRFDINDFDQNGFGITGSMNIAIVTDDGQLSIKSPAFDDERHFDEVPVALEYLRTLLSEAATRGWNNEPELQENAEH